MSRVLHRRLEELPCFGPRLSTRPLVDQCTLPGGRRACRAEDSPLRRQVSWTPSVGPLTPRAWLETPAPSYPSRLEIGVLLLLSLWACGRRVSVVQAQRHVHSVARQHAGDTGPPYSHRRPVAQRLMRSPHVVKGHPRRDTGSRLATVSVGLEVELSSQRPQPSIEIWTPAASRRP